MGNREALADLSTNQRRALVHNFCGTMFKRLRPEHGVYRYERAEKAFEEAEKLWKEWYLPYENHADALSMRGVLEKDNELARRAVDLYAKALERLEKQKLPPAVDEPERRVVIKLELNVAMAATQRLYETGDIRRKIDESVEKLEKEHVGGGLGTVMDDEVLYTFGCWYATVWRQDHAPDEARSKAGRYVAAAVLRNRDDYRGDWVPGDPDLSAFGADKVSALIREADAALVADPALPTRAGKEFSDEVERILERADWRRPPARP